MFSNRGFTLVEAVVAIVVGALVVIGVGGLSERLIHHRATTDSNSAAMSLAEKQMETILADPTETPSGCPGILTSSSPALCAGTHPVQTVDATGTTSVAGPYRVQWTVVDASAAAASPLVPPTVVGGVTGPMKQITVTVTLPNNPLVNATIVRFKYNLGV